MLSSVIMANYRKGLSSIDLECLSIAEALSAQQAMQPPTLSNSAGKSAEKNGACRGEC